MAIFSGSACAAVLSTLHFIRLPWFTRLTQKQISKGLKSPAPVWQQFGQWGRPQFWMLLALQWWWHLPLRRLGRLWSPALVQARSIDLAPLYLVLKGPAEDISKQFSIWKIASSLGQINSHFDLLRSDGVFILSVQYMLLNESYTLHVGPNVDVTWCSHGCRGPHMDAICYACVTARFLYDRWPEQCFYASLSYSADALQTTGNGYHFSLQSFQYETRYTVIACAVSALSAIFNLVRGYPIV